MEEDYKEKYLEAKRECKESQRQQNRSKIIIRNMKKRLGHLEASFQKRNEGGDYTASAEMTEEVEKLRDQINLYDDTLKLKTQLLDETKEKLEENTNKMKSWKSLQEEQNQVMMQIVAKEKGVVAKKIKKTFKKGLIALKEANKILYDERTDLKKRLFIVETRVNEVDKVHEKNKFLKVLVEKKETEIKVHESETDDLKKYLKHENCGYMKKQGGKVKSMKWRWFVFSKKGFSYYKERNDKKPLKTVEYTSGMKVIRKLEGEVNPLSFALRTKGRTYIFLAASVSERMRWMLFLEEWVKSGAV